MTYSQLGSCLDLASTIIPADGIVNSEVILLASTELSFVYYDSMLADIDYVANFNLLVANGVNSNWCSD